MRKNLLFTLTALSAMFAPNAIFAEDKVYTESDCVREKPEGESRTFIRYGESIIGSFGGTYVDDMAGMNLDVVFAPDGRTIWFHNLLAASPDCNSWVKGELDGNRVIIPSGQVMTFMDYGTYYNAPLLSSLDVNEEADENSFDRYVSNDKDIELTYTDGIFSFAEGTVIGLMRNSSDQVVIELDMNGKWLGYADTGFVFKPMEDTAVTFPAGQSESWSVMYPSGGDKFLTGHLAQVAISGDEIHIKGLFGEFFPAGVVKGTVNGDRITIPQGQYIGMIDLNWGQEYHLYAMGAVYEQHFSDKIINLIDDDIELTYDADTKSIRFNNTILLNSGTEEIKYGIKLDNPILNAYKETAAIPTPPQLAVNNVYMEYIDENNPGYISVYVPCTDTEGNFIDPSLLSFEMYLDGEPLIFSPEHYVYLEDSLVEIPYGFSDEFHINLFSGGIWTVAFFKENTEEFGIRSIYRGGDSVTYSDMTLFHPEDLSVEIEKADNIEIESIKYFDMTGMPADLNAGGMIIRQTVYSDGSVKTDKILSNR